MPLGGPPHHWKKMTLGNAVEILDRFRVPVNAKERTGRHGDVPYYGATGRVGWIDQHLFDEELVLLGEDGAPFLDQNKPKAYLVRGKSWVNNHAHVLRGKELTNQFLMHQLNALDYHGAVTGTTRLKLPQGPMKELPLLVPPRAEQEAIVSEIEKQFTRLDAGVESLKRLQAHLRRYRASVLAASCEGRLLARGEPASGKEVGPGTVEEVAASLSQRRREAALRAGMKLAVAPPAKAIPGTPLPSGWSWATLGQLAWDYGYGTSVKCSYEGEGPPVLRIPNISRGLIDQSDLKRATGSLAIAPSEDLRVGDLLIVRTNGSRDLIGRGAIVQSEFAERTYFASYLIRFRLVADPLLLRYVAIVWHSPLVRGWIEAHASNSAGQHNVNLKSLASLPLPLPPPDEQRRIVAEAERLLSVADQVAASVDAQLRRADALRRSILSSAFSGRLTVTPLVTSRDSHSGPSNRVGRALR